MTNDIRCFTKYSCFKFLSGRYFLDVNLSTCGVVCVTVILLLAFFGVTHYSLGLLSGRSMIAVQLCPQFKWKVGYLAFSTSKMNIWQGVCGVGFFSWLVLALVN